MGAGGGEGEGGGEGLFEVAAGRHFRDEAGEQVIAAADGASQGAVADVFDGDSAAVNTFVGQQDGAHGAAGDEDVLRGFEDGLGGIADRSGGVRYFDANELPQFFEVGFEQPDAAVGGDSQRVAAGIDDDAGAGGGAFVEQGAEEGGIEAGAEGAGEDGDVAGLHLVHDFLFEEEGLFVRDGEALVA